MSVARWVDVEAAAAVVGYTPVGLRRLLERNARKAPDGAIEAHVPELGRARKLRRQWRVLLADAWTQPEGKTR